jgi:hypothetical protein
MFTPEEWETMPPDQRRQAIGDMSQIQAAKLYAALPENRKGSPRLTEREWMTLGKVGQDYLIGLLPDWEADIVLAWTVRHQDAFIPASPRQDPSSVDGHVPGTSPYDQQDGSWSKKSMDWLILWSCILPIIGLILFVFNFWRPGKLKQSFGLLAAALFMALLGYPFILGFFSALLR